MAGTFAPQAVAITGASSGIGAALAEAYAAPGVTLFLAGRNAARLTEVSARCRSRGASVVESRFDVTDADSCQHWIADADTRAPLDLVIANAGVSSSLGPLGEPEPREVITRIFAVNTAGVLNVVTPAVEAMLRRRRGRIAIIGSLAGLRGLPACPAYSASKAAAQVYGEALRGWLAPYGIGVTVVCPGYVDSPMSLRVVGPKPLLITAERAATLIRHGIARNRPLVAFPWVLALGLRLLVLLPSSLALFFLKLFHFSVRPG